MLGILNEPSFNGCVVVLESLTVVLHPSKDKKHFFFFLILIGESSQAFQCLKHLIKDLVTLMDVPVLLRLVRWPCSAQFGWIVLFSSDWLKGPVLLSLFRCKKVLLQLVGRLCSTLIGWMTRV